MKNTRTILACLIVIISVMLTACGQLGVERPIKIDGLKLQITKVEIKEEYQMGGGQKVTPQSDLDTLLIVTADIEAKVEEVGLEDWDVEVEGGRGFYYSPSVRGKSSIASQALTSAEWIFVVHKFEDSFIFHINDSEITLDSFIPEISELNKEQNASEQKNDNVIAIALVMCDQKIELSSEKEIEIYYLEKVGDGDLAKQYVDAARLEVTLDGEIIDMDPGEVLQDDDYGNFVRYKKNIDKLNPGEHVIEAKLIFSIDIRDEKIDYGEFTTNENLEFICLINSR